MGGDWMVDGGVRGVVLAGGLGRRFGGGKDGALLCGRSLLGWVRGAVVEAGLGCSVVRRDVLPDLGPLGGVLTAGRRFRAGWLVFLACDMPLVGGGVLVRLLEAGLGAGRSAVCCVGGRRGFPFVLRREDLGVVEGLVGRGERSVLGLFGLVSCVEVGFGVGEGWRFVNVNVRGDLARAEGFVRVYGL